MKRNIIFFGSIIVLGMVVARVFAADTATWAMGYPKTGTATGTILVKGTASLDAGDTFTGKGSIACVPAGGRDCHQHPLQL